MVRGLIRKIFKKVKHPLIMKGSLFNSRTGKASVNKRWAVVQEKQWAIIKRNERRYKDDFLKVHAYLSSDGWVGKSIDKDGKISYCIAFYPDVMELAEDFVNSFERLYCLTPKIKKVDAYYHVRLKNKVIYTYLQKHGSYDSLEWKVPEKLILNRKMKILWLRCFIDSDGHVSKEGLLQIQSVNKKGILKIKKLLGELGVNTTLTIYERKEKNWNINYILTVNKTEMFKMRRMFNMLHPLKRERLRYAGVP